MPCMDGRVMRQRLLSALLHYESQVEKSGRVMHRQRRLDLEQLTYYIQTVADDLLLEREIKQYLADMVTSSWISGLLMFGKRHSYLRDLLSAVLNDENRKYHLYIMWVVGDQRQTGMSMHDAHTVPLAEGRSPALIAYSADMDS